MADLIFPTELVEMGGFAQGRGAEKFLAVFATSFPVESSQDFRILNATTGTITDQVVLKSGAAEVPYVNGRVWLLRLADGYKAWEGFSDAAGNYTATGLELGVEYVAVAIDPLRNFKTVGAGPVTAV